MTVAGKRYVDCTVLDTGSMPDAEDSSYDSDYDAEDSTTTTATTTTTMTTTAATRCPRSESQISPAHPDVSRTASDTLAAEFAEYVTIQGPSPTQNPEVPKKFASYRHVIEIHC
ncbi:PREDICTED: uncharacterized protein LOC108690293 [Atta colombica]|uniref:uncharacterized protein LOC108690293 n=1 Tax=Atta colombica TaxID=520822 RepID=UPI00084CD826|nr:PREDICTED: uncharacterized protein LOC108690293 [Atta colombica]